MTSGAAPVTVGIPTYARGGKVLEPLARLLACTPPPAEIIVHVDASDGLLERQIKEQFPSVRLLSSKTRVGPGGGRHRALHAATQPYFATFDDDSWPIDADYFARVVAHFAQAPDVALLESTIAHRGATAAPIRDATETVVDYTGCGHALRVGAYRDVTGYVDRPYAYGLEERDVGLQLHAAGWRLMKCGDLRVFHDTDLAHHNRPEVTTATIENAALLVWLRYPLLLWPYGFLQYANVIYFMLKERRWSGIAGGILRSPVEVWRHRHLRRPLPARSVRSYLRIRHQKNRAAQPGSSGGTTARSFRPALKNAGPRDGVPMKVAPITVGIPTYARGTKVTDVLERVLACQPPPAEVIVHVDQSDGQLEQVLQSRFPTVQVLSSATRVGPGGGRHRCLSIASQPIFSSLDDDSWPMDADYFARMTALFSEQPQSACLAAVIFDRNQCCPDRTNSVNAVNGYTGCGYAIRADVYQSIPGHVDRVVPYGIEEIDIALQLHGAGWKILECGNLRVFHDTVLAHHAKPEITAGIIENAVLLPWLRYPVLLWPYGLLQLANVLCFMVKSGRLAGIPTGLARIPLVVWKHRKLRRPLPVKTVWSWLRSRRSLN